MADDEIDGEVEAIKATIKALDPLTPDTRANVIDYVIRRLKISVSTPDGSAPQLSSRTQTPVPNVLDATQRSYAPDTVHIKTFKEQKQPRSANEMAALVAYYLSDIAPQAQRQNTISAKDLETYFKIADFPLPAAARYTLQNARSAGYLDSAGSGEYKLNAVGHNLVVHNLPREDGTPTARRPRAARRQSKRPKKKS